MSLLPGLFLCRALLFNPFQYVCKLDAATHDWLPQIADAFESLGCIADRERLGVETGLYFMPV